MTLCVNKIEPELTPSLIMKLTFEKGEYKITLSISPIMIIIWMIVRTIAG